MGVPKKEIRSAPKPFMPAMEAIEERAIRMMGTIMGATALKPLGSLPYSATSSSYVLVTSS